MRTRFFGLLRSLLSIALVLAVVPCKVAAEPIMEFPLPTAAAAPCDITSGPDGNVWFTERVGAKVGRITPAGVITEFPLPAGDQFSGFLPAGITTGSDGNVWFAVYPQGVGRIGTSSPNTIDEFSVFPFSGNVMAITSGPDGNVWFTINPNNGSETRRIGRINPADPNDIVLFSVVVPPSGDFYGGISGGADGNVWFTEYFGNKVGRITPDGVITEFDLPTPASYPGSMTLGADGNVWFTEGVKKVGRITPAGVITEYDVPDYPNGITNNPDGNIWLTMGDSSIGRLGTDGVLVTTFSLPNGVFSQPLGITSGPDGNVWFTEGNAYTNAIGRITLSPVCRPLDDVYADNSRAFGLFEGVVANVTTDRHTVATLNIQPTQIITLPILGSRGVNFWVSIDNIAFDPAVVTVEPNSTDSLGATFAEAGLIAPGTHASFEASFCHAGTVTFELGLSPTAIALTMADTLISLAPIIGAVTPAQVLAFADVINSIPLYASATNHIGLALAAARAGNSRTAFSQLTQAGKDLVSLAFNTTQRAQLLQAFRSLGLNVTARAIFRALVGGPARVFETFSDVIVLAVQTDFGTAGTIQVSLVGQ